MAVMTEEDYLAHYGILRKSGRYPWGSGETQSLRNRTFLDTVADLRKQGMSDVEIARGFDMTTTQLRALKSIAGNQQRQEQINTAQRLADKGMSNVKIGEQMGVNESTVRSLLAPGAKDKADLLEATAQMLRTQVEEKGYIDIGAQVERSLPLGPNPGALIGISSTKFNTAVAILQEEGYKVGWHKVTQIGTGKETTIKFLRAPDAPFPKVTDIKPIVDQRSDDGGRTWDSGFKPPISVSAKRVGVRYAEDGGAEADGVIYVRPGAKDLSLGGSQYAQVRIDIGGTHYLKGMAILKDDLPPGVDLVFNTNKVNTGNKLDAMKPQKDDPDLPFGAVVRQLKDKNDKVISAMNIVNEEGKWETWNRSLPSQMLSKQTPTLAKKQLNMTFERRLREFDEISSLTNATVRKKLLDAFADETDSAAVHLKAAAIPKQATQVILPLSKIKETEVYAPNFRDGDHVALVRFPHGGTFEIPQLTVNNRNPEGRKLLGPQAKDAVGIHHKVAERLSGADFDGDTVLVIPNNRGDIKSTPALEGLKGFDPRSSYPKYEGMRTVDGGTVQKDGSVDYGGRHPQKSTMQREMGDVSNLITDMTIQGANTSEIARAVRHSMVVIDCEKHVLDYKASARSNGIPALKEKYQGRKNAGASTLISKAKSPERIRERKPRPAAEGGPIDRATGKRVFVETGVTYVNKQGQVVEKTTKLKKLEATDDAHTLSSGTPIERIYADHSNRLKSLANEARKESVNTSDHRYDDSAAKVYKPEVDELNAALDLALRNAPLERQAQRLATAMVNQKKAANPGLDKAEERKIKNQALAAARVRTGARKNRFDITPRQWEAIQAGAISKTKLQDLLDNANLESIRTLATPRQRLLMSSTKIARAQAMISSGYTQAEIADALGVSLTTLKTGLSGE